ncbi:hypothetical protein PESHB5_18280 [Pediococcus parvulus]|nr:hypothetical protein PPA04_01580 [Pediococcus parvulus]GHC02931.1 hypothetical protein GCM10008912_02550 [Pediococcus parvulus]
MRTRFDDRLLRFRTVDTKCQKGANGSSRDKKVNLNKHLITSDINKLRKFD